MAVTAMAELGGKSHPLWITGQVIREFCAVVSRRNFLPSPVPIQQAARYARALSRDFFIAHESQASLEEFVNLIDAFDVQGRHIYDVNLVAVMKASNIRTILTNNPADFSRFESLIQIIDLKQAAQPPV